MNRRAGVLGNLEGEAAHRTAPLNLTQDSLPGPHRGWPWAHLTGLSPCLLLPLPEGPLPWPEASHPIGPAPQLPSEEPLSITACAPPKGLCDGCLSRHPAVQEEGRHGYEGAPVSLNRGFQWCCYSSWMRAGILQNAVEWVYADLGDRGPQKHICCFLPTCPKDTDQLPSVLISSFVDKNIFHMPHLGTPQLEFTLHFTDEEPEAQRGQPALCHTPQDQRGPLLGLKPGCRRQCHSGLLRRKTSFPLEG